MDDPVGMSASQYLMFRAGQYLVWVSPVHLRGHRAKPSKHTSNKITSTRPLAHPAPSTTRGLTPTELCDAGSPLPWPGCCVCLCASRAGAFRSHHESFRIALADCSIDGAVSSCSVVSSKLHLSPSRARFVSATVAEVSVFDSGLLGLKPILLTLSHEVDSSG